MSSVSRITPEVRSLHVPAPLRDLPGYLIWRYEQHPGEPKPRKVPYWPDGHRRHGQQGSAVDRARLTTFVAAREAAARRGFDGVGLAMLADWGLTALDFDNCVGPDGSLPPEIQHIACATYAEYSPSGRGIRAFLYGNLGNHKSKSTPDEYGLETFHSTGFVTITGDVLPGVELVGHEDKIAPVDARTAELCARRFKRGDDGPIADDFMAGYEPRLGLTVDQMQAPLDVLDADMDRDGWLRVGMALHHECEGDDTGFDLWNEWSAQGAKYPGEESLRYQWDRFHEDGSGRQRVTMASVLKMAKDEQAKPVRAEVLLAEAAPEPEAYDGKFRPIRAAALSSEPPRWLIRDVLPQSEDPVILYGASTAGKTFVAIDLAMAVARGESWRGHPVEKGPALFVTAEGSRGFRSRVQAYCLHYGIDIDTVDIDVLPSQINIMEAEDVKELVRSIRTFGEYRLVIFDTLAQVTPGANENAGEDMSRALANIKAIQIATGSTVMVIHHAGKDVSRGSRGWSGLKAAAEAQLEVSRDEETGERAIRIDKLKDGQDGVRYGFELQTLTVAMYEDGTEYTSCVVVPADLRPVATPRAVGRGATRAKSYSAVQNHILEVIEKHVSRSQTSMRKAELVKLIADLTPPPAAGERDVRRQNIVRSLDRLLKDTSDTAPLSASGDTVFFHTQ